jgi:hypothetical protein
MPIFNRIILYVSNQHLTAALWRFGRLGQQHIFSHDENGLKDFQSFLKSHQNINIYCLVDVVEEDYHFEILPHTRWRDRKDLITRKLSQIYRSSIFRTALFLDRDQTQTRKDDRFLFLALNHSEVLKPWLDIIEVEQSPLAGVYLLSMVSQQLAKALKIKAPHLLLVEKLATGFRQTYLYKGELRMSRLAPYPIGTNPQELDTFYADEIQKTQRYLLTQRLLSQSDEMQIRMPMLYGDTNTSQEIAKVGTSIDFKPLDLSKVVKKLGLSMEALVQAPELLHMTLIARNSRLPSLAPKPIIRNYRINAARQNLNIISVSILFFGLLIGATHLRTNINQQVILDDLIKKTHQQEAEYQKVARDFPITPLPSDDLQRAVEIGNALKSYQKSPTRMMQVLNQALVKTPEIQVNRIKWVLTDNVQMSDTEIHAKTNVTNKDLLNVASLPQGFLYEAVFFGGEIKRFNGDYRAALSLVNQLTEVLKADARVAMVEIVEAPVNVSSFSKLEGSTTDEIEAKQSTASFTLKLILQREVP